MLASYIKIFLEKKGANMHVNDIKIFLKSFDFLLKYNKEGFFW